MPSTLHIFMLWAISMCIQVCACILVQLGSFTNLIILVNHTPPPEDMYTCMCAHVYVYIYIYIYIYMCTHASWPL